MAPYVADCQIEKRDQNNVARKSGWVYRADNLEDYCLVLNRGRIHVSINVISAVEKSVYPSREVATELAAKLFNSLKPTKGPGYSPDLGVMTSYGARIKWAFLGTAIKFILVLALILHPLEHLRALRRRKGATPAGFRFDAGPERNRIILRQRGLFFEYSHVP